MTTMRRDVLTLGAAGLAGVTLAGALTPTQAAAQAAPDSLLRTVLDRGKVLVGTGSTNAPWHFEDEDGKLVGMDVTMGHILAKALFDDPDAVEFVLQDPAQRIPNLNTGKVDIAIQFMTITGTRAQLVNFTRPYYVEGMALISVPNSRYQTFDQLNAAGSDANVAILQNVGAETAVHMVLPDATVMQVDTQANVLQSVEARRADAAVVDLSTVGWLVARNPDRYIDSGKAWYPRHYGAGVKQGDFDWLHFIDTAFTVAMFDDTELYDEAFKMFFGAEPPPRKPGFPSI